MRPLSERKQRTIDFVCKALELLEGDTHVNAERYRKLWENMTDKEFTKMMETLRANPMTKQIAYFEVIEFERDLKLHNIEATADFMKVPLYEYVAVPDVTGDPDNVVVTPEPVPVGYAQENASDAAQEEQRQSQLPKAEPHHGPADQSGEDRPQHRRGDLCTLGIGCNQRSA